jgi:hypothetical protein
MSKGSAPKSDNEWEEKYQKEEDVRALARAHAVKKDPVRHAAAKHHAKSMVSEHKKRLEESKAIIGLANSK